jgi:DNA-binding MarR family transcriptional regulator
MSHNLQACVSYLLIQISKAHRHRAEIALDQYGLHPGQEMILFQLWMEEGITQSQLVENLCVEPPTVTKMLQRLEKGGLVTRRQDTQDARVSRVYLTAQGRALQAPVQRIWEDLEAETIAGLSEVELALLRRLLMQLYHNLER